MYRYAQDSLNYGIITALMLHGGWYQYKIHTSVVSLLLPRDHMKCPDVCLFQKLLVHFSITVAGTTGSVLIREVFLIRCP